MNKKIGAAGALVDLIAVLGFAASMLLGLNYVSYFCSMFIAFGFVIVMCGFLHFAAPERKTAGYAAAAFSAVYAAIILVVYFTQLTTVRLAGLTEKARELLDFQQMGHPHKHAITLRGACFHGAAAGGVYHEGV